MGHRSPAITSLLAITIAIGGGCATNPGRRSSFAGQFADAALPQNSHVQETAPATSPKGGLLTEAEAPQIASATKFADAENAAESKQMQSMRQQMARRYGCCGR